MDAIIVDDQQIHREDLQHKILKNCPEVQIVATADSVRSALRAIVDYPPKVLFLDVELGDSTGFDLLGHLPRIDFKIIFVSGMEKYAHRAFKYLAIDYLMKPVNELELISAVNRAKEELSRGINQPGIDRLREIEDLAAPFDFLCINDKKGFTVIQMNNMVRCEADGNCTHFFVMDDETKEIVRITSSLNLRNYEEQLFENDFMRVHRSHIINTKLIAGFNNQDQMIRLAKGISVPLGDSYRKSFQD